jgi:hypothetical protein
MKKILVALLLFLTGCDYETPLRHTADAPARPALTGTWAGTHTGERASRLTVEISGEQYNVTYAENEQTLFFEGFEIRIDDTELIQLKLKNAGEKEYLFVKYELTPEGLSVYRLNPKVVSADCATPGEILAELRTHRRHPELFIPLQKFTLQP